ncbi:MAG: TRAP transporter large permease subunit [Alphaproteobacteria bacterium]|nr:TRAP transporter large permease subunit [Alphaproteobacteria bacterium]
MSLATIGEITAIAMFLSTIGMVMFGFPVAFTLAGTGLIFAYLGHLMGTFDLSFFIGLSSRYLGTMTNEVLVAVPLFVFMGVTLERSKIAEKLLTTMGQLFGTMRGGLGISVILVGALLAASTGIVGATVVTMGLLSLPAMMRAGYDPKLATGVICASGTLGQIIPPSTVLIFIGDMLQGANTTAQAALGNFAPDPVSVGDLFAGAFFPGLMLVGLYCVWVLFRAFVQPSSCPAIVMTAAERSGLGRRVIVTLIPPLLLIIAVLGSILAGIASPTESASVGAIGAMLLAALSREFNLTMLREVMRSTLGISSMVFVILFGASVFSLVFRGLGGEKLVEDVLAAMPGGAFGAVMVIMALMFFLGFFLDTFEIIFIVVPITAPILLKLGVDPVWLGVMIGMNLQTSFLTPPFGFALFYLRGVAPRSITTGQIYTGIIPFVIVQIVAMGIMWGFPRIATWLPEKVYGSPPAAVGTPGTVQDGRVPAFGDDTPLFSDDEQTPAEQEAEPYAEEEESGEEASESEDAPASEEGEETDSDETNAEEPATDEAEAEAEESEKKQ